MKARVKETGEIVEVKIIDQLSEEEMYVEKFGEMSGRVFHITELDFDNLDNPDYWTRLEHTYAGMAMQAMLTSPELMQVVTSAKELLTNDFAKRVAVVADRYAHALVEELKKESK